MTRRGFLRSIVGSTAAVVVAPAAALEWLEPVRTYFDFGRNVRSMTVESLTDVMKRLYPAADIEAFMIAQSPMFGMAQWLPQEYVHAKWPARMVLS